MTLSRQSGILFLVLFSTISCSQVADNYIDQDAPTDFTAYDIYTPEKRFQCEDKYFGDKALSKVPEEIMQKYEKNCGTFRPSPNTEELKWLKNRTRHRMIFVQGGEFIMGDFGPMDKTPPDQVIGYDYLPMRVVSSRFADPDYPIDKIHEITRRKFADTLDSFYRDQNQYGFQNGFNFRVKLDDYSMTSHMIEEQEYNLYAAAKQKPLVDSTYNRLRTSIKYFEDAQQVPAIVSWEDAQGYCQWVGELIGQPLSLPTEAQWEYAARNRGEPRLFATNNGLYEPEKNIVDLDGSLLYAYFLSGGKKNPPPYRWWLL